MYSHCVGDAAYSLRVVGFILCVSALSACGGKGDSTDAVAPPVTLQFDAAASSVTSGSTTMLTWNAQNATACAASGVWAGSRPTQGTETTPALTADSTFDLRCEGSGAAANKSVTVTVAAATTTPTVSLVANPTSVTSGSSSQLAWTSTNANSCAASGAWSGSRVLNGNQTITNITANSTYTISCTGTGGTASASASVTVQPPSAAPTLTLTANPATVASGGQSVLTWSTSNATSCIASGGWVGQKATSGNETVGPLAQSTNFTLSCAGAGGNIAQSASVAVAGGGNAVLSGAVDSSYVARFGDNRVYLFAGSVTPDDLDGDSGDPVATIPVVQDANACSFSYSIASLAPGTYTIAFTRDAASDQPGVDNTLAFVGTRQVTVSAGVASTANFRPSTVLHVGPGRQYSTLRAANAAATAGSVIEIDAGTYTDDVTVWRQNGVVIRGVGGRAHLHGTQVIQFSPGDDQANGKGIIVVVGSDISIENLEISGARVTDENGAAIRNEGENLSVCNGYFHDNENGFLGGAYGTLLIEYTELSNSGSGDVGHTHNIYVDDGGSAGDRFIFRHNYSHNVSVGHLVKTRARENHILYNRLMDEATGSSSYNIDVPNGGLTFVIGNLIQQGPSTDNSTIISYGAEGLASGRTHELYLVNNTIVNDLASGAFVQTQSGTALVRTINNLFIGGGTVNSGVAATATTNLATSSPGLVNQSGYDYHLTAGSPARDAGTAPGSAAGQQLTPVYQYVHTAQRTSRPLSGPIDIGAYEYQ